MPFLKDVEIKDEPKYGNSHKGVFAKESIRKHEIIWRCDPSTCEYLGVDKTEFMLSCLTREQCLRLMSDESTTSQQRDFLLKYIYSLDDDLYDFPRKWRELKLGEEIMLVNHSCDPNCGFMDGDPTVVIAIRDIDAGEELCEDYQYFEIEPSFYDGLSCLCGSFKCRGILRFDQYRNIDWQNAYYKYSILYIQRKIDELKTKWYSSRCYLKYYGEDIDKRVLALTSLKQIRKDNLVAQFSTHVKLDTHYIRHSDTPTCYLEGKQVFAAVDLAPETELTLNYNQI